MRSVGIGDMDKASELSEFERLLQASPAVIYRMHWQPDAKTPEFMRQAGWPAKLGGSFKLDFISEQVGDLLGDTPESLLGYPNWWAERIHPDDRERVVENYTRLFADGRLVCEYRLRRANGTYIWLQVSARLYHDDAGLPVEIVGAWMDISERKQAEEVIHEGEQTYRGIFNALNEAVYILDKQGCFLDVNDGAVKMYGFPRDYFIGKTPADLAAPDRNDMDNVVGKLGMAFQGDPQAHEFWALRSNGEEFPKDVRLYPGNYFGQKVVIAVARDITERKQAKERLQLTQFALDHAPDAIFWMEPDGRFVYVNEAASEMLGYTREELLLMGVKDIDPGLPEGVPAEMAQATRDLGPQRVETTHRTKDGHDIPVEIVVSCIVHAGKEYHCSFARDISERKQAESRLAESEARLQASQAIGHVGTWDWNPVSGALLWSDEVFRILGFEPGEVSPSFELFLGKLHPEDRERLNKAVEAALLEKQTYSMDCRVLRKDGSERVAHAQGEVEFDTEGQAVRMLGIFQDVTERKQDEQAMRESGERIQAVARNMTCVVYQFGVLPDGSWYFPYISESIERFLGITAAAVMVDARQLFGRVHHKDAGTFMAAIEAAVAGESAFAWQGRFVSLGGEVLWFSCSSEPQRLADGSMVWNGVALDETKQHRLEEQFRQAQKMEAVGTMAGGIAHDFNNMLGGMLGQLYLLKKEVKDRPVSLDRVEKVVAQGFRAAGIIEQMLTFARKSHMTMAKLPLTILLKETLKMHRVLIPENIGLQTRLEDGRMMVTGDASVIQQMLLNLLTNARDAVAEVKNPVITVALDAVAEEDDVYRRHAELAVLPLLCLSVRDNGCGIPLSEQAMVFDPFFTTKEVGKGTGLGLAMVYGGMQSHGGVVELVSEPGRGNEFRLYFPRIDYVESEPDPHAREVQPVDGVGVLIADDEEDLRAVLREALEDVGYRVFAAVDGEQAVALFEKHRGEIGIAVLDVVMPRMGGVEAFQKLRQIEPQLPVIFHTGYGANTLVDQVLSKPLCESLSKPATIEQLAARMSALLQRKG